MVQVPECLWGKNTDEVVAEIPASKDASYRTNHTYHTSILNHLATNLNIYNIYIHVYTYSQLSLKRIPEERNSDCFREMSALNDEKNYPLSALGGVPLQREAEFGRDQICCPPKRGVRFREVCALERCPPLGQFSYGDQQGPHLSASQSWLNRHSSIHTYTPK